MVFAAFQIPARTSYNDITKQGFRLHILRLVMTKNSQFYIYLSDIRCHPEKDNWEAFRVGCSRTLKAHLKFKDIFLSKPGLIEPSHFCTNLI
jgi:hypothetical protein